LTIVRDFTVKLHLDLDVHHHVARGGCEAETRVPVMVERKEKV
jgi:hypothetical protein